MSLTTQLSKNLVPGVLLFVFCVRVKSDVNDERKILGTKLAHENEVGQKLTVTSDVSILQ